MLTYRAAAWMVRTNAPEIAMGLPTADEIDDMVTLTPEQYSVAQVVGGEHAAPAAATASAAPAPTPTAETKVETDPAPLTLAQVTDAINRASDPQEIDAATALIERIASEEHRAEADIAARAKRKQINQALDAKA